MVTAFLSSTTADLAECRTAVYTVLEGLSGYHCTRMEDFGSWDVRPFEFCRKKVLECDLFVCLAGPLYGSVAPTGQSFTEVEYDAAVESNKPRLMFLTTDDYPVPAKYFEPLSKRRKQDKFRNRLSRERLVDTFSDCSELCTKVVRAVRNWEAAAGGVLENAMIRFRREGSPQQGWRDYRKALIRIGRDPYVELPVVDDNRVSWEHGHIIKIGDQFLYRHLSNTNATRIRGQGRKTILKPGTREEVLLNNHDRITVGMTTWKIEFHFTVDNQPKVATAKEPDNIDHT